MNQVFKLFSSRALKLRYRVGERSAPIFLLTPPLRATLALGALITVGGGLWATLARIPLTVDGTGVLLPAGTITTSISLSDGFAQWMFHQPSVVWQEQAWRFKQNPSAFSDQKVSELARAILEVNAQPKTGPSEELMEGRLLQRFRGQRFPEGRLLLWVRSSAQIESLSSALEQLDRTLKASAFMERNIDAQQALLQQELKSRSSYLKSMKELASKEFVSRTSILQEEATVDGIVSKIYNNDNERIEVVRDRDKAYQSLRIQLASLLEEQFIFSPRELFFDQVEVLNGQAVRRGQELLKLSDQSLINATLVPVFLGINEAAQVRPGMPALVTPAGYNRADVGGIRSRVVFKARLPGTLQTVTDSVGVSSLAEQILRLEPSPTLVILALEREVGVGTVNSGGYRWSSRSALPFPPTPGERIDVQITTRQVRPIELVMPIIQQFFGFAPPNPPTNSSRGSTAP